MAANFQNVEEIGDLELQLFPNPNVTRFTLESFYVNDNSVIYLPNRRRLPVLPFLTELRVKPRTGTTFNPYQVLAVFKYARKCRRLTILSFIDCVLPLSLPVKSLSPMLHKIEVSWNPLQHVFPLDSTTGKWFLNSNRDTTLEANDQICLRRMCFNNVIIQAHDSEQVQMSTILLLEIASSYNIPITRVYLVNCYPQFDEFHLSLNLLPPRFLSILSSLQELVITDDDRELAPNDLAAFLSYSSQCTSLEKLQFGAGCTLLNTDPVGLIPPLLNLRNVKVWILNVDSYRLNLENGQWQRCDQLGNLPEEEGFDARYF